MSAYIAVFYNSTAKGKNGGVKAAYLRALWSLARGVFFSTCVTSADIRWLLFQLNRDLTVAAVADIGQRMCHAFDLGHDDLASLGVMGLAFRLWASFGRSEF